MSASCAPAEQCGADNGGCDSLTACALIGGEPACGSCPVGFTGNGLDGCVATLIGITVANGELLTAITPETTAYEARVSVFERRAHITFQIPAEASLEIDGEAVDSSEPWSSKVLQSGENAFDLRLDVPGHAQVRFDLVLRREAVQRAYIKADPPAVDDGFGRVVCLDGDQLLVGNFVEDRRGMASTALRDTGSAYIFEHTESGWQQQAYLKPEALTRDAWFGSSVILRGDVALISALQQDSSGAVYTFARSGSTWTEGQVLESGTPLTDSWFGLAMVLHDDLLFVGELSSAAPMASPSKKSCARAAIKPTVPSAVRSRSAATRWWLLRPSMARA